MVDVPEADGRPTKEFFVSVLGRDILLIDAIVDLVDNSVDGARRLRKPKASLTDTESFKDLWIKIDADSESFRIRDNCGGISLEVAEEYAFRFGRPPKALKGEIPAYATGQFGVGMKRALFKLGTRFMIESTTKSSRFDVDVDVEKWLEQDEDDWHFDMTDVKEGKMPKGKIGTDIHVKKLRDTIADDLSDETVLSELRESLHERHMLSLHRGLKIELNGSAIKVEPPLMLATKSIGPAYRLLHLNGGEPIRVELLCGVRDGPSREAGWSVFLNDRMVLSKNTESVTGWGDKDEGRIPRYHNQYGRFRGYVFMTCSDTSRLPWDTTKTGLDEDQPEYRQVEREMISQMEPVIRFLDDVAKETAHLQTNGKEGPLLPALEAEEKTLFEIVAGLPNGGRRKTFTRRFKRPQRKFVDKPTQNEQSIQFRRPKDEIATLKKFFEVNTGKAAGEEAWKFVFDVEDL
jgi:histidine kinase/DNA gyrase B/HSP90-like ATPase